MLLKHKITCAASGVVIAVSLLAIHLVTGNGAPEFNEKPHEAIGMVLGRETLSFLKPGGKVTVFTRDTATFKNPAMDVLLNAFKKAIKRANAPLVVHALQVDPLPPVEVPPGDFFEAMRKSAAGDVIVSFMGAPLLNDVQRSNLPEQVGAKIVVFCPGVQSERVDFQDLFQQGIVNAAVISRRPGARSEEKPKDLQGWFDQSFVEVTSKNVASLFAQPTAK